MVEKEDIILWGDDFLYKNKYFNPFFISKNKFASIELNYFTPYSTFSFPLFLFNPIDLIKDR